MRRDAHSMRIVCDPSYEFAMHTPSAGEAVGVEKGLLVRCHRPSQHGVAMGKPAEAANDAGVELGVLCDFIVAQAACQLEASFLIGENLRMHERQIEESALQLRHIVVEAALESAIGNGAGDRIGLVGPRLPAEHVARKLIENEDERERASGVVSHDASSSFAAAHQSVPKRAAISASKASSLANHLSGPAVRQNASTSTGAIVAVAGVMASPVTAARAPR